MQQLHSFESVLQGYRESGVGSHDHLLTLLSHILGLLGNALGVARFKSLLQPGIVGILVTTLARCQSHPSTLLVLARSSACLCSILLDCKGTRTGSVSRAGCPPLIVLYMQPETAGGPSSQAEMA